MSCGEIPHAPIWDEMRTLGGERLPSVDIIYGGFPCQDISVAGRGAGLAGERSGLFFEVARLVGEIRPRFVFLENVSAITVRGAERVVGELCRLRYDCRWGVLSAADVGANHRRERWWLLANAQGVRVEGLRAERKQKPEVSAGKALSRCDGFRAGAEWWQSEPNVGRVAHGIPRRVDRLRALGNAVVPQQAREAFERLMGLK